ncbi:hypothetical protein GQ457_09G027350 [Hibiscus cannabinus]
MCCTSLRNLRCNLKLRSIEARMGKTLKGTKTLQSQNCNLDLNGPEITRQNHEGINHTRIFSNIPKGSAYQREGRNKVKVKDLKPKRIKDYLECKISQRNLNQPRKSAQAGPVVFGRDIPFVIQLKQIIEAPK